MVVKRGMIAGICVLGALVPPAALADDSAPKSPLDAVTQRAERYEAQPPGTVKDYKFYFGPYTVPPGHDANRFDIELPVQGGFILAIEPSLRRAADLTEPSHQEAHIHHAHWFAADPGNKEDNYTGGMSEWIFGNGDEETRADFQERTDADPNGPVYGQYISAAKPQLMIYMLHNKTAEPLEAYIVLDVRFKHGSPERLEAETGRPHRDLSGVLFGEVYDVPREAAGDGLFETTKDMPESLRKPFEWVSTIDGTIIGTGGHLHPGGIRVVVENLGSAQRPCPDDGKAYGGTTLLVSKALFRNAPFSEDFQMSVSHPAWRAPIRKGDRIRITGVYENKDHAWYDVMTHEGLYIDPKQPPAAGCAPTLVNQPVADVRVRRHRHRHVHRIRHRHSGGRIHLHRRLHTVARRHRHAGGRTHVHRRTHTIVHRHRARRSPDPTVGVPNRPFDHHPDTFCGPEFGAAPCERPEPDRGPGVDTSTVTIANFLYMPGDRSLAGASGAPARVKRGTPLTFVNADQQAGIRHSVTTCPWPCNGRYVANYPYPDGTWDSGTLGYDPIDGGSANPVASTPPDLGAGRYAYFCRIHPWMRGAFEVVP